MTDEQAYNHSRKIAVAVMNESFSGCRHIADDLIEEGLIAGMIKAKEYDPSKSIPWTFLHQYIRGAMFDFYRREYGRVVQYKGNRRSWGQGCVNRNSIPFSKKIILGNKEIDSECLKTTKSHEETTISSVTCNNLLRRVQLTAREKQLIYLIYACGARTGEVMSAMKITQGRISQIRKSALLKLKSIAV